MLRTDHGCLQCEIIKINLDEIHVRARDYCTGRLCRNQVESLMVCFLEDEGADLFSLLCTFNQAPNKSRWYLNWVVDDVPFTLPY